MKESGYSTHWFVVYTYPKFEKRINDDLGRLGIESFLPLQKVVRQWSDRKKKLKVPMFPNYVFVKVASIDQWKVLSVNGVVRFIRSDGMPAIITEKVIDSIRKINDRKVELTNECFSEGDKVKVMQGPLSDLEGILVEKKGKSRIAIRVDIMKQSVLVDVAPEDLEKMELEAAMV